MNFQETLKHLAEIGFEYAGVIHALGSIRLVMRNKEGVIIII
jgi:hypothetical protein